MFLKQLSVFLENREGRVKDVLKVLKDNDINIVSLSLADSSDYGLLRLIVDYPKKSKEILSENGFTAFADRRSQALPSRSQHWQINMSSLGYAFCC